MALRIITAVGTDRPGLVGQFTGHLHQAGVNIADSRMVNLRGQFALLLLVEGESAQLQQLEKSAPQAGDAIGLQVTVAAMNEAGAMKVGGTTGSAAGFAGVAGVPGLPYRLKTYSMDQPGIVHGVTSILHEHGVNIEELTTRQESAPFAGTTLFTMQALLTIPADVSVKKLRQALETLCDRLNIDMDLEPGD